MTEADKIKLFQEVCSALQKKIKDKGKVTMSYEYYTLRYRIEFINRESMEVHMLIDDDREYLFRFLVLYHEIEYSFQYQILSRYGFV